MKGLKKVEKLEAGMEVWINLRVEENQNKEYPLALIKGDYDYYEFFTKDCKVNINENPIEMFTIDETEIPELKGIEMEVSVDLSEWIKDTIIAKTIYGFISDSGKCYKHAR